MFGQLCEQRSDTVVSMSYWTHHRPVQRIRAVDVREVARAAASLLDAGGMRGLTVRAVARALDVAPASLYSRVRSVEDIVDLALDTALGEDEDLQNALEPNAWECADLDDLMVRYFRHLQRHRWAAQVIGQRAPRGPQYLRLSERMCVLLEQEGAPDPLGAAYALSNFVIGSATTSAIDHDERSAPVDAQIAPRYAQLHSEHVADSEEIVALGISALRSALTR